MVAKSSTMNINGLPDPPSFSKRNKFGGPSQTMQLSNSENPAFRKGAMNKVVSRFFTKDKTGQRGVVEVCYFSSSNVAVAMYDHKRQVLSITFKSKGNPVYEYYQVPKDYWESMKKASSVGRFVYFSVRKRFFYRRVR